MYFISEFSYKYTGRRESDVNTHGHRQHGHNLSSLAQIQVEMQMEALGAWRRGLDAMKASAHPATLQPRNVLTTGQPSDPYGPRVGATKTGCDNGTSRGSRRSASLQPAQSYAARA